MRHIKSALAIVCVMYAIGMFYGCAPIQTVSADEPENRWFRTNMRIVQTYQNEDGEIVNELVPPTELNGMVFPNGGEIQIQEKTGLLRFVPSKPKEEMP